MCSKMSIEHEFESEVHDRGHAFLTLMFTKWAWLTEVELWFPFYQLLDVFPTFPTGRWVSGSPMRGAQFLYAMLGYVPLYVGKSTSTLYYKY